MGGSVSMMHIKRVSLIVWTLLFVLCLCACGAKSDNPDIPKWPWERKKTEALTLVAQPEDFAALEEFENLKELDLSGSTCYEEILTYMQAHPEVDVTYTVSLGNTTADNSQTSLTLEEGAYDYNTLKKNLAWLPLLRDLSFPRTELDTAALEELTAQHPDLTTSYTVEILGEEYKPGVTEFDLSGMQMSQLDTVLKKFQMLPGIVNIELMNGEETAFSPADVKVLMDALPEVKFHYEFMLFGQRASTETERLEYVNMDIGNEGETQLRQALDIMPGCTYIKLEKCGLDNEVLGGIQADYPNTTIAWRIQFGEYSVMTDTDTIRAVYDVYDKHVEVLKYCTKVKYIDMGHNSFLSDLSFVQYMPDLEIMIASGCSTKDISAFANCKKLEFLELAYCYSLTDISPLKECESLRFLNVSFSKVSDLSPLDDLKLERFVCLSTNVPEADRPAFEEKHPDCWTRFTGENPYSLGWRYDDVGVTRSEYYIHIREVFDYDAVDRELARQEAAKKAAEKDD